MVHDPEGRGGGVRRTLLVEDDDLDAELALHLLARLAPDPVDHATNLQDAEASLAAHHYDLVLLDLSLPDGRGDDLVGRLRAVHPGATLVVLTGFAHPRTVAAAREAGAHEVLSKDGLTRARLAEGIARARARITPEAA